MRIKMPPDLSAVTLPGPFLQPLNLLAATLVERVLSGKNRILSLDAGLIRHHFC
jgi:hypothetical protein